MTGNNYQLESPLLFFGKEKVGLWLDVLRAIQSELPSEFCFALALCTYANY